MEIFHLHFFFKRKERSKIVAFVRILISSQSLPSTSNHLTPHLLFFLVTKNSSQDSQKNDCDKCDKQTKIRMRKNLKNTKILLSTCYN